MIDLAEIDTRQPGASVVDFIQQPKESRLSKSVQPLQNVKLLGIFDFAQFSNGTVNRK